MMKLDVNPTRMELLRLKRRLVLAKKGHKLLKDKQDELVRNFLSIIEDTKKIRLEIDREIQSVFQSYSVAEGVVGGEVIENLLAIPGAQTRLKSETRKIMNLKVPKFTVEVTGNPFNYGTSTSTVLVDNFVKRFGNLLNSLLKLAELEKTSILLAEEIEKTRRRVNALEYILIPNITETIKYITMKLSEMERSNLTRIMKVKDIIQQKREESRR
ncbi:MAG: V-type ATP synthase subunit D [Spirochaetes bacterium]|nr:MAG: V-type ATP synthase subunit D [Spirochaetota bacterium]